MVDKFSKYTLLEPINTTLNTLGAAKILLNQVYRHFGMTHKIISDWGTQFISGFMKEVYKCLGIEKLTSTAYHPQTDGQTECVNQEVEIYL